MFNPPHLIPLVEVVPGKRISKEAIVEAVEFYTAIGMDRAATRHNSIQTK